MSGSYELGRQHRARGSQALSRQCWRERAALRWQVFRSECDKGDEHSVDAPISGPEPPGSAIRMLSQEEQVDRPETPTLRLMALQRSCRPRGVRTGGLLSDARGLLPRLQTLLPLCTSVAELCHLKSQRQRLSGHRISVCLHGNDGGAHQAEKTLSTGSKSPQHCPPPSSEAGPLL